MKPPWKHMAPRDVPLFASFVLSEEGRKVTRWQFDVTLGPGTDPGPNYDPDLESMALYLTKFKADAVGWQGTIPTIYEVKPKASLSAFGQVQTYAWYWQVERGETAWRAVITDYVTDQVRALYDAHFVDIWLVTPATPAEILQAFDLTQPLTF